MHSHNQISLTSMESYVDSSHFSQIFSSPAESNIIVSSEPSSSTSSSIHFQYEHFYISKQYLNTASSSELSSFSSSSFSDQMLPLMEQTDLALASDYEDNTFQNFLSDSSLAGLDEALQEDDEREFWRSTDVANWKQKDVIDFALSIFSNSQHDLSAFRSEAFADLDGRVLLKMSLQDFQNRCPRFGAFFFASFRSYLARVKSLDAPVFSPPIPIPVQNFNDAGNLDMLINSPLEQTLPGCHPTWDQNSTLYSFNTFEKQDSYDGKNVFNNSTTNINDKSNLNFKKDYEKQINEVMYNQVNSGENYGNQIFNEIPSDGVKIKPKRGRPKKKVFRSFDEDYLEKQKDTETPKKKLLWEFFCELLKTEKQKENGTNKNKYSDRIIQWEEKNLGVFRIIDTKKVVHLWGKHKGNHSMSFEKLTRALRWCKKKSQTMSSLPLHRNWPRKCFRFGPKALNWEKISE